MDVANGSGRELALMLSRRCNIACSHCGIESSPKLRDRLARDDAERFIVEAAGLPEFAKVTFTGGEPTLFRSDLKHLIRLCTSLGLATRIVTNGTWGRRKEVGRRLLEELREAGLSEINFSADRYHLEFMAAETLRNALECARELGYSRIVSFVSNGTREPFEEFSALYEVPREQLLDLRELLRTGADLSALREDHIFVFYGGLIGLGRAERHPEELRFYPLDFFPDGQACGEVVNKPVIYPDGSFQACCCAGGKVGSFTVGNAFDEDIATLYDRMTGRSHFRFINLHGPRRLFDTVRAARPDLGLTDRYTSICEMCVRTTERLPADEVDRIVDERLLRDFVEELGSVVQVSPSCSAG